MKKRVDYFCGCVMMLLVCGCVSHHDVVKSEEPAVVSGVSGGHPQQALPPVVIYKTRGNYNDFVPVNLAPNGNALLSYPGVHDVFYQGILAKPTPLESGFLLDNRGIDTNSVFLDYTYEVYSALPQTPLQEEIMQHIMIRDGIEALYSCRCARDTALLNEMIRRKDFHSCVKLR